MDGSAQEAMPAAQLNVAVILSYHARVCGTQKQNTFNGLLLPLQKVTLSSIMGSSPCLSDLTKMNSPSDPAQYIRKCQRTYM